MWPFCRTAIVHEYEWGIFVRDGALVRALDPGRYRVSTWPARERIILVDKRVQTLAITGQEILTSDKVSLRVNFVAHYRVSDPWKALKAVDDYRRVLYEDLQLSLRAAVGAATLDDLLAKKSEVAREILEPVRVKTADYGVDVSEAGVKDVVLPGDLREILNRVVAAKKEAEAVLVKRREETAAVRALANTAALLEKNPLLLRLRELETVERMAERGNTFVLSSDLTGLIRGAASAAAPAAAPPPASGS